MVTETRTFHKMETKKKVNKMEHSRTIDHRKLQVHHLVKFLITRYSPELKGLIGIGTMIGTNSWRRQIPVSSDIRKGNISLFKNISRNKENKLFPTGPDMTLSPWLYCCLHTIHSNIFT